MGIYGSMVCYFDLFRFWSGISWDPTWDPIRGLDLMAIGIAAESGLLQAIVGN